MDRRTFAVSALSAASLLLGCQEEQQQPAFTATLLNNGKIQQAMKDLNSSIGVLQAKMLELDFRDWRELMPEIHAASVDISDGFQKLRRALEVPNT